MLFQGSSQNKRQPRNPFKDQLQLRLDHPTRDKTLLCVGSNISDSGICVYTFIPLKEGQCVMFEENFPMPYHKATVRWIKQYNQNLYRVGLFFTA